MPVTFLRALADLKLTHQERAIALIWHYNRSDPSRELTVAEINTDLVAAGYTRPNPTRLSKALKGDRRVVGSKGRYRIDVRAMADLAAAYDSYAAPAPPPASDSVLPTELFGGKRSYLDRIVYQVNASYDATLYDCTAVMLRRVIETLVIDLFEAKERESELKDSAGNYRPLSEILAVVDGDRTLGLSRNAKQSLKAVKRLGDLSAHNRKYTARQNDIDRERGGIRVLAEELLHLLGWA